MSSTRGFPDPGIEPGSFMSPALAGGFFTTSVTWETRTNSLTGSVPQKTETWLALNGLQAPVCPPVTNCYPSSMCGGS